ncbi:MAG: DoxX family protein [Acidobacteriota bacterium]|nr:DoxX family protein [Acidobacteriota bacterium]
MTKRQVARESVFWIITLFPALVCLRSGLMKMPGVPGVQFWMRDFQRWGYPGWFRFAVGVAELVSFALLLVPRLAGYGASVFAVVMLGAILTHATHNESRRLPFNFLLLALSLIIVFARQPAFLKKLWKAGNN